MDLVKFDDDVTNDDAALFNTVEAFSGNFFFSASVELKTKAAGEEELAVKWLTQTCLCLRY